MQTGLHTSGSIVFHGAILVGFVGLSLLHVEPLGEPVLKRPPVTILEGTEYGMEGPPADAAPPPLAAGGTPSSPDAMVLEIPTEDSRLQETVSSRMSDGDGGTESAVDGTFTGHPRGVPGGIPGGLPGGVPGGAPGGIPGGVPGGSGSPLNGLTGRDRPVRLTGAIRPPERITFVKPEYPEVARKSRTEGKVILEIVVGRTGTIENVTVLRSHPLFDQAAVAAVRKWQYRPARQAGLPVKVYLTVVVSFELQ